MIIWHISDTHCMHEQLEIPEADCVIFSGDCSNVQNSHHNEYEVYDFLNWFECLTIPIKVFVPGNHDTSIERRLITRGDFEDRGIVYLENRHTNVFQERVFRIWGSPYTPSFSQGWAWNMKRSKLHMAWDEIPDSTDIVVTHGPPKGVLDLSYSNDGHLEMCGCEALRKRIAEVKPKLHLFGHIHNSKRVHFNSGVLTHDGVTYSNGSCCTDGNMKELSSGGNLLTI